MRKKPSFDISLSVLLFSLANLFGMAGPAGSPTSSIDSSSYPSLSSAPASQARTDLSTDLRLGLSIATSSLQEHHSSSSARNQVFDWPPIKRLLRTALEGRGARRSPEATFFVKVYMEGVPIGRKLDLYAHHGYNELIRALCQMFKTTIILSPGLSQVSSRKTRVLTYEDKEGDWMMVGDVPWELFLRTVNRLKITSSDKC